MSIAEYEQLESEEITVNDFMNIVKDSQINKEHISIDLVIVQENSNFTTVINGISPDTIKYIEETGCVHAGSYQDNYSLTIPEKDCMYMTDATADNIENDHMTMQFSTWSGDLSIAFMITYDSAYLEHMI